MPIPPLEGPKPGITCLACGKATLVLSADGESWACDRCKRAFSLEAVEEIVRLRGIARLGVEWRRTEVAAGAIQFEIRGGDSEEAERAAQTAARALRIAIDEYNRETRDARSRRSGR